MKPPRSIEDLATRLTAAATAPLQVLEAPRSEPVNPDAGVTRPAVPASGSTKSDDPKPARGKGTRTAKSETLGINLRPSRALYQRYVGLAADRSRTEGRMVSAQQIMLEVLERARV